MLALRRSAHFSLILFVLIVFIASAGAQQPPAQTSPSETAETRTGPPHLVKFSGQLPDARGIVPVTLALYKDQHGGAPLWLETQSVQLDAQGRFTMHLGAASAHGLPPELFASGEARWVGVRTADGAEQERVLLVSVPYAMKAQEADTLNGLTAAEIAAQAASLVPPPTATHTTASGEIKPPTPSTPGTVGATNGWTDFTDNTTNQVVNVTQTGTGAGLKATTGSTTQHAIWGVNTATTGTTRGVYGEAISTTTSSAGVYGISRATTGLTYGVLGITNSTQGTALNGTATAATGNTIGLRGQANSTSGIALQGAASAVSGLTIGVNGFVSSPAGIGGLFDNRAGGKILSLRNNNVEKLAVDGSGNLTTTGNVSASGFTGSGTNITNVNAALLNGFSSGAFAGAIHGHDVTQVAHAAATNAPNTFAGNQSVTGNATLTGTVTAAGFIGDGSQLTNLPVNCASSAEIAALQAQLAAMQQYNQALIATSLPSGAPLWSKSFGSTGNTDGKNVATDTAGNVVTAGTFGGTVDLGGGLFTDAGGTSGYLAKYSPDGVYLWSKHLAASSAGSMLPTSIAIDSNGNIIVVGYLYGTIDFGGGPLTAVGGDDVFVAKYSSAGAHLWSKRYGGTDNDFGESVAVDGNGNIYVTGFFYAAADFGTGFLLPGSGITGFMAKYDPNGVALWAKALRGTSNVWPQGIAVAGTVFLVGQFQGNANFDGIHVISASDSKSDIFLAKYTTAGTLAWVKRFGSTGEDTGHGLALDPSGLPIITGEFEGTVDFGGGAFTSSEFNDIFIAKYDTNGTHQWSRHFAGNSLNTSRGIAADALGNVVITGDFADSVSFGGATFMALVNDTFVAKYNGSTGSHIWSMAAAASTGRNFPFGIATDPIGNVLVTGRYLALLNFGGFALPDASTATKAFLVKLKK